MLLIFAAVVIVMLIVSHEVIMPPSEQKERLTHLVPEFACPNMVVKTHRGRWSRAGRRVSGVLQMPSWCRQELQSLVAKDPNFREERCNLVDRCWTYLEDRERFTLTFYPSYVAFRFSEEG